VRHLASFERSSALHRRAAGRGVDRAAPARGGLHAAQSSRERAHGTYWWPLGLLCAAAGIGALTPPQARDGRPAGRARGRRHRRRRQRWPAVVPPALPAGARDPGTSSPRRATRWAERTVVLRRPPRRAHWSLLFAPHVSAFIGDRWPALLEKTDTTPPVMFPVIGGPLIVALAGLTGLRSVRLAGAVVSLGAAATFAEIGSRSTVPGANDNLSGVATLIGVARRLREEPVEGLRVLLVSTGSEESFMEGMQAFARRHFASLPVEPHARRVHRHGRLTGAHPARGRGHAVDARVPRRPSRTSWTAARRAPACASAAGCACRNATDGLIALRRGYPTVMLGSVNRYKLPDNYHWPTDTADNVDYSTVTDAVDAVRGGRPAASRCRGVAVAVMVAAGLMTAAT